MKDNAIILLSGGLDSITVLAMQRKNYKKMISLSFFYDQKHKLELELAKKISEKYKCNHIIINLDPQLFLGTSLVSKNNLEIPTNNIALNPACSTNIALNSAYSTSPARPASGTGLASPSKRDRPRHNHLNSFNLCSCP